MEFKHIDNKAFTSPKFLSLTISLFLLPCFLFAQKIGHQIKVKIDGFDKEELYLGYFYGDKQYIKDTAYVEADGKFYFEENEKLDPGVYMIILPPDNKYFQLLVNDDEQWFSLETKMESLETSMKVENSLDTKQFYDYLNFLGSQRPKAEELRKNIEAAADDEKKKKKYP